MELVFILTGWRFDIDGKKATSFGTVCKALGVQFDLSSSGERALAARNAEQRVQDLQAMTTATLQAGELCKQDASILRGTLGFADSFFTWTLGASGRKAIVGACAWKECKAFNWIVRWAASDDAAVNHQHASGRLCKGGGWMVCFLQRGLGAWASNWRNRSRYFQWFLRVCWLVWLSSEWTVPAVWSWGQTDRYLQAWTGSVDFSPRFLGWKDEKDGLQVCYGDNDSARYPLIRGSCLSQHASALRRYHLEREAVNHLCTWYARVPTEANVSDYPSTNAPHPLLSATMDESAAAVIWFDALLKSLQCGLAD